jgi:GT2 family glycosyltransferase
MLDADARPIADHMGVDTPSVSVVILNWNGKQDTLECLTSVMRMDYPSVDVIVVDNGSIDGSAAAIRATFPDVTLLETGSNLGYAGGNNVGMRYAMEHGAQYVLLLNNDTVVDGALVREFIGAAETLGDGAILSAQIYFHAEPETLWYAGGRVVPSTGNTYHEGFQSPARTHGHEGIAQTDYASGCAFFVSTRLLSRIGLFDERFFLLYEETDLCYRARDIGAKCYVVPRAKVWHKVSVSFGGANSPSYIYFWSRNRLLWAEKHLSWRRLLRLYIHVTRATLTRLRPPRLRLTASPGSASRRIWTSATEYRADVMAKYRDPVLRAQLRGIRDYVLRRFGNRPGARA